MPVYVELSVDGKTYKVRRYYVTIERDSDSKGRPQSDPSWKIFVVLDGVNDGSMINWMLDPKKLIDGKLTLYRINDGSKVKDIEFTKSTCKALTDYFNIDSSYVTSYMVIMGKDIKINSAELQQTWPGSH